MKYNEAFPSDFLKADDLQGRNPTVVISRVSIQEIGQGQQKDRKLVIEFLGKQKKLVCNKTNAKVISGFYGEDMDAWLGKAITLTPRQVEFQGDVVWAIRVDLRMPVAAASNPQNRPAFPPQNNPPVSHVPAPAQPKPTPGPDGSAFDPATTGNDDCPF